MAYIWHSKKGTKEFFRGLIPIGNVNLTYEQNCTIFKYVFDYIKCQAVESVSKVDLKEK
jgi:hypothetical protein